MMKKFVVRRLIAALVLLCVFTPKISYAASGTIYVDTGGSATNSGTTDANTAPYSGAAAAWTTGTNTITLDTNTNLTGLSVAGDQAIYLNNATNNSGQNKIFWITGVTGCTGSGSCSVTTSGAPAAPTCSSCSGSSWAIGGRYLYPSGSGAIVILGSVRPGDTVQFNNDPAARTAAFWTGIVSGDLTTGPIRIIGKPGGPRILLDVGANNVNVINASGVSYYVISNLELRQSGSSGALMTAFNNWSQISNVKVNHPSGGGTGDGIQLAATAQILNSEVVGVGGDCVRNGTFGGLLLVASYLHGCGGDGVEMSFANSSTTILNSTIANNTGRGIYHSSGSSTSTIAFTITGSTVYNNSVGLEVVAGAQVNSSLWNSIFQNNGSGANVSLPSGSDVTTTNHGCNVFYASAGTNVVNFTLNSSELTTNPLLGNPGSGDFSIPSNSPAANAGCPGPVGSATSYLDAGSTQRQHGSGVRFIGG